MPKGERGGNDTLNAVAEMLGFDQDRLTPRGLYRVRCRLTNGSVTVGVNHVIYDRATGNRVSYYNPAVGPQRLIRVYQGGTLVADYSDRSNNAELLRKLKALKRKKGTLTSQENRTQ